VESVRRIGAAWPLITAAGLSAIWVPALSRGFVTDDFSEVPLTWSELLANPLLINDGRPVETATFALLPNDAFVQHGANLLLYLGCLGAMWRLCRRMNVGQWSTFLALSSFFHPAFLWSVTWIAQRADLLAIFFLLLAVITTRTPVKLGLIALCSAAKTPYVFQNVVFSLQFAKRRQRVASAIPLLLMIIFVWAGYMTYYAVAREGATLASPSIEPAISLPLRAAKLIEGTIYVFAPVPMFAVAWWGPVLALVAYAVSLVDRRALAAATNACGGCGERLDTADGDNDVLPVCLRVGSAGHRRSSSTGISRHRVRSARASVRKDRHRRPPLAQPDRHPPERRRHAFESI